MTTSEPEYMVDTTMAIENGISKKEIIQKVEKLTGLEYHDAYDYWESSEYSKLSRSLHSFDLVGIGNHLNDGYEARIDIDWYQIDQIFEKKDLAEKLLKKSFNDIDEFKEELL